MSRICVIRARRTPQGRFLGALAKRSAVDLGVAAARATIDGIDPGAIDSVIVGNVLSAGLGMNVARQIAVNLNLPIATPAFTVNAMCASGMQAVLLAMQAIPAGDARCVLCGGTESMSNAPYLLDRARGGYQVGDGVLIDSLMKDGLTDPFGHGHMGLTAERLADEYGFTRLDQDAYAARSQQRHATADADGRFAAELVPLAELARDEHPRPNATEESLAKLRPAFKPGGTVTAGNASGINDGAAMLVVCDERFARERGHEPLAYLSGAAIVGCDPARMGLGPVHATRSLCAKLKTPVDGFDHVELNEAFAAQALSCVRELGLDGARVNPHGGAIAVGHPIGASGARIVTHLSHVVAAAGGPRTALATLCVGGGMGCAIAMEAPGDR